MLDKSASLTAPPATVTRAESAVPRALQKYLALDDFEPAARRRIPKFLYGYISGGAETDAARARQPQGLRRIRLRAARAQRRLRPRPDHDAVRQDLCLAVRHSADGLFGAVRLSRRHRADAGGDGRERADDPQRLVADHAGGRARAPIQAAWYQAYLAGLPERIEPLVDRVAAAGYDTFVVTADVPVPPNRENNIRNGFQVPLAITPRVSWDTVTHPHWLFGTWARTVMNYGMPHFENMDAKRGPPVLAKNLMRNIGHRDQLAWKHVELIRKRWKGKLVVKGLVSPADARIARESGVDGVMLSNHGGRQLDYTMSGLRTLPEIAAEAKGMTVMVDGGIRRGTDVIKALALGAHFVWVGRPFLYAAIAGGEAGVQRAITLLQGRDRPRSRAARHPLISEITPDLVRKF